MRKLLAIILITLFIAALFPAGASALTGYNYYIPVTFSNSTGADITGRYIYTINADGLVDGGFMQADGDDMRFDVETDATSELSTINTLDSSSAVWCTDYFSVPANGSVVKYIWVGNLSATARDQVWVANYEDVSYAADAASLDITTNLTVSSDIYLDDLPTREQPILYKPGNYLLSVDSANFNMYGFTADGTEVLRPNAAGAYNECDATGGAGGPNNYQEVDEAAANDADFVNTTTNTAETDIDAYNLDNTGLGVNDFIHSVTVTYRCADLSADPTYATPLLYVGGSLYYGTQTTTTAAYTNYTYTWYLNPNTDGMWLQSDLDALQAGIKLQNTGNNNYVACSQLFVTVYYTAAASVFQASIAGTIDAWVSLEGSYDGANVEVTDGSTTDDTALVAALNTTSYPLFVFLLDGKTDDSVIDDNGTVVLNLTFEADEIDATTITDGSASSNDVTYSRAANPAGITVVVGALYSTTDTYTSTGAAAGTEDTTGLLAGRDTASMEPGSGVPADSIPDDLITSLGDSTGVDDNWLYKFLWVMFALALLVMGASMRSEAIGWVLAIVWTGVCAYIWHMIPEWSVYILTIIAIGKISWRHRTTLP